MNFVKCMRPWHIKHVANKCVFYPNHTRQFSVTTIKLNEEETAPLYDVIISGGGLVGAAMAAALGHEPILDGKKVLLLESAPKTEYQAPPQQYSSRTCALSNATQTLLHGFGAWKHIEDMRCQPVKRMQVWDSCSDAMISFQNDDLLDDLATIVENDIIQAAINRQVASVPDRVEVKYSCKAKSYKLPQAGDHDSDAMAEMELEDGQVLKTRLLVGADGSKSLVRKSAGIKTMEWEYGQMGVVATVELSEPTENNVAWQRYLTTGPIALLPLSDKYSCLIWSIVTEDAKHLLRLEEDSFVDAVNNAFWSDDCKDPIADYASKMFDNFLVSVGMDGSSSQQLPPTIIGAVEGSRAAFPLGFCHANQYVKKRTALIGDSAHRIHPMAGQGVNLGFGDVESLKNTIVKATSQGSDIGSLTSLLEYESERQREVVPTMATVDGLAKLYSTASTPIVLLRSLGLQATNACAPIKDMMTSHAKGEPFTKIFSGLLDNMPSNFKVDIGGKR